MSAAASRRRLNFAGPGRRRERIAAGSGTAGIEPPRTHDGANAGVILGASDEKCLAATDVSSRCSDWQPRPLRNQEVGGSNPTSSIPARCGAAQHGCMKTSCNGSKPPFD